MGVPGFFAWLLKKNKNNNQFILDKPMKPIDYFYIDANCLFHPQCFKILEKYCDEKNVQKLEEKMIEGIIIYIEYIIKFVDPKKLIYIAVDGVAPMAKINQQRKRRYKSVLENKLKQQIKDKYNIKTNNIWSNVCITPGTEFMEKLHLNILNFCEQFKVQNKTKIIYSSYHSEGEGEHKILQHIKQQKDGIKIIYGLDADLFFLSMASQISNIYLLREHDELKQKEITEGLKYISIDETKKYCDEYIKELIILKHEQNNFKMDIELENNNFCNDFVFLCYFLGNDFVPNFPSLDIALYGLDIIIDSYVNLYINRQEYLIQKNSINYDYLIELTQELGKMEYNFFKKILPKKKHRECNETDDYKKELWELENLKNNENVINFELGYLEDNKFKYYEYYFNSSHYQHKTIEEVCDNYYSALLWITNYYFNECENWSWQYLYFQAPFVSDFSVYLKKNKCKNEKIIPEKNNRIIEPYAQLLCVIPIQHECIIPESFRKLMSKDSNIIDYFPEIVELDTFNKSLLWKCSVFVPVIDINRIMNECKKIKLSKKEKNNNKILKEFIY